MEYCQFDHSDHPGSHMECLSVGDFIASDCPCSLPVFCHYCDYRADVHPVDSSHTVVMLSFELEVYFLHVDSHSVAHQIHNLAEFALT